MAIILNQDFEDQVLELIKDSIKDEVEKEFDSLMEELNNRKNVICGGIVMKITKQMKLDTCNELITIDLKEIRK